MTQGSPTAGPSPTPRRIQGGAHDPLKGWTREDATLADACSIQDAPIDRTGLALQLVCESAQRTGVVDGGGTQFVAWLP
jgi:hypothetical protein